MYKNSITSKVPGDVNRGTEREKQGYIKDLRTLSKGELLDLKNRQELLLHNKNRISKLPDKGAKILKFYEEILGYLKINDDVTQAAELFSELNISAVGKRSLAKMEWNNNHSSSAEIDTIIDSDDDLDDLKPNPLAVLAHSVSTEKKIVLPVAQPSLITDQDLIEIEQLKQDPVEYAAANIIEVDLKRVPGKVNGFLQKVQEKENVSDFRETFDAHSKKLCKKEVISGTKDKFLPFRTTKSNVHDIDKERSRFLRHAKGWDNTAATPPYSTHCPAKLLTLDESIQIQAEKNKMIQEAVNLHAEERLKRRVEINEKLQGVQHDVIDFNVYRSSSESEDEIEPDERFNSDAE
ncbi:uncharacterized protein LOC128738667 [Sabethes cyaneus]|uniref:uncharacterized protein LOC128738667 n=1 Tax=Sabethes cyaneus TaxID=53552 RepID=UPI00237EE9A3|nr:uncharacterized protein LOC128738667 [Sabethes cyaneus]